jgi:O-glycosyl hydrolase
VQLDQVRQIIRGFGLNGTITDGKALPWSKLFTLEGTDALGLSILRIGMTETGGHRDVASGWDSVKGMGARVIGSCWSAQASWKDNNAVNGGGHLKPDYYDDWAKLIAKYAKDNGLYAMSIGNETDFASCDSAQGRPCNPPLTTAYPSMVYTGKELAAFAKVAGPIFKSDAPGVKMITPEASLWIHVWSNLSPTSKGVSGAPGGGYNSSDPLGCGCFSNTIDPAVAAMCKCTDGDGYNYGHWLAKDPDAWSAFDIMGVHEYESQIAYQWPADVTGGVRDKEVWETEMSGVLHWPEQGPSKDIANGLAVARWIHSALTIGEASAWLWWWYKDYYNGDNEGLALLMSDSDSATPAKRYFTMGNFSRYIRPDKFHAVRVAGPSPDKVLISAYKGDAGELVVVAINETNAAANVPIAISGGTAPAMMVPYVTNADANWKAGTAVAVTGGSLAAALPAMSVTTFVSQ